VDEAEVLEILRQVGAVRKGHFLLSSGRHSDIYAEKFRALERPELARDLGEALAARFNGLALDIVLAPAVGGIVFGFAAALALGARFIFCEREDGRMRLRRGFSVAAGEQVLVVEDVVTTGRSLEEVIELVPPGKLAGIGCLLDRSKGTKLPVPLKALAHLAAETWEPRECPLCAAGVPLEAPGSRHLG
jgi:orotate phosphoribosyltransferase